METEIIFYEVLGMSLELAKVSKQLSLGIHKNMKTIKQLLKNLKSSASSQTLLNSSICKNPTFRDLTLSSMPVILPFLSCHSQPAICPHGHNLSTFSLFNTSFLALLFFFFSSCSLCFYCLHLSSYFLTIVESSHSLFLIWVQKLPGRVWNIAYLCRLMLYDRYVFHSKLCLHYFSLLLLLAFSGPLFHSFLRQCGRVEEHGHW